MQTVVFFAVLLALIVTLPYVLHAVQHPWAYKLTSPITFTSHWEGTASFPGERVRMIMKLHTEPWRMRCRSGCTSIDGSLTVCRASGAVVYDLWGDADDSRASRFQLTSRLATPVVEKPGATILHYRINGEWPGGDALTMTVDLVTINQANQRVPRSDAGSIRIPMHRTAGDRSETC